MRPRLAKKRPLRGEDRTAPRAHIHGIASSIGALVLLAGVALPARADADDALCRAAPAIAAKESTDELLTAADALVTPLDRPEARALYLAVLARDPRDDEATIGLARVDAWDGCLALAERGYREVLARSPTNVEARAGLADVLTWTSRWAEADEVLAIGLLAAPLSPELLTRRSRVAATRGDIAAAARYMTEAERVAPLDPEVREARDRLFVGQARLGERVELFPSGYDNVYTTDASVMQRWRRLRFELGATVISRHGALRDTRSGPQQTSIIDGRPTFGAFYHFDGGGWAGAAFGVSAPALALPQYAVTLSAFEPLGRVLSAHLSTAYWEYADARDVIIVSPALGIAVADAVDLTFRYWLTTVVVRGSETTDTAVDYVHSAGVRVGWRPDARLTLGLDYTYGVQLDRNPSAADLLELRSHIVTVLARKLVDRSFGVDLAVSVERRTSLGSGPVVLGEVVEAGMFARW